MKKNIFKVSMILMLMGLLSPIHFFGQSSLVPSFIGDYRNASSDLFAQVYIQDNTYKVNLVNDPISRDTPKDILNGTFSSPEKLKVTGELWNGKIENNTLTISNGNETIELKKYQRKSPTLNAKPPKGGIVLYNGKNLDAWLKAGPKDWLVGTSPADQWAILPDGALEVTTQSSGEHESIITKQEFGDLKLHLEFRLLGEKTNGGVYLMSRYELNIKDAYGFVGETPIGFGNIAKPKDLYPNVNVALPPMQWQTFDVDFRAPRFDETGTNKIENARITVIHNGVTIYDNVELEKVKGATAKLGEAGVGPLYLQDHGNVYQFRNVWVIDNTLKGTEKYHTLDISTDVVSKRSKDGKKSGGKKSGGKKKIDNTDFDHISKKGGSTKKSGSKKKTDTSDLTLIDKNVTKLKKKTGSKDLSNPKAKGTGKNGKKGKDIKSSYKEEMNPLYADVDISLEPSAVLRSSTSSGFMHPGILLNKAQLNEIKRRIDTEIEPQYSAFKLLIESPLGAINYTPNPRDTVSCGPHSRPNLGCKDEQNDSGAAYTQALLWSITGNPIYAENAIKIMNAWSQTLTGGHNYANGPVQAAWTGAVWPRAAEIIRYTFGGWSDADILRFQNMLRTQYLPSIMHGDCENGNKELAMCDALINIGVFLDDVDVFNLGVKMWRGRTPAYIYLKSDGIKPIQPPGCAPAFWGNKGKTPEFVDGLMQESARDDHHIGYSIAAISGVAETARQQGVDLYNEEDKRLIAAMEFQAQYLPPNNVPAPENLKFANLDTWEILYNHFHNRLGYSLPNMSAVIPTNRPTGTNHNMLWETLTHGEIGGLGLPELSKQ